MIFNTKRIVFWICWLLIVISAPITLLKNSTLGTIFSESVLIFNFFQRLTGLLAFNLIFIQIILGSRINYFLKILGGKVYKIHLIQGLFTYVFLVVHSFLASVISYQTSGSLLKGIETFIPSFNSDRDILINFGRASFLLVTLSILAAYLRTKPFIRRAWRSFHLLNYLIFYLLFFHMRIGTDVKTQPFNLISKLIFISITSILVIKLFNLFIIRIKNQYRVKKDFQKA